MKSSEHEDLSELLPRLSGPLRRVSRVRAKNVLTGEDILSCEDIEALVLAFNEADLCVLCLGDSDELVSSLSLPAWEEKHVQDVSSQSPWNSAVGLYLFTTWTMQNDSGYDDAIQFEFGIPNVGPKLRIQLEGAASQILVYRVVAADEKPQDGTANKIT